jgi:aminoglycoside 2''-phosphotransferase
MEAATLVADRQALETIVAKHVPQIEQITYIDHGHDNLVVVVNESLVFRFPRNDKAARRLTFEIALLQRIKGKITVIPTPELVEVSAVPLYAVTTYRPGGHLTKEQIESLSDEEQAAIGAMLAEFIHQFGSAISPDELTRLRQETGLVGMEEPWADYFTRLFETQPLPNLLLTPIVNKYYGAWKNHIGDSQDNSVIHDDLHPANILFVGSSMSAVLDFGDANIGSAEEEMRGLYSMGELVLRATIKRYHELTGRELSYELIQIWTIMNDLARFTRYLGEEHTTHPAFLRAQANLRAWIPNFPL